MRKSTAQALSSTIVAVLFLLPNLASAYSYIQIPVYPQGYFDFLTQQSYLNSAYSASGSTGFAYTFLRASPIATSTAQGFIVNCGGSPSSCAPAGFSASASDTLDAAWVSAYGIPAPDGQYWVGIWLPDGGNLFESSLLYVSPYYKSNGQWYVGTANIFTTPINWGGISFPQVFSSTTQGISASSSLWQSLSVASSTLKCDSGNFFADGLCSALSYLFSPDPTVINQYVDLFSTSSPSGFFSRFPASYAVGLSRSWSGLSASSTSNASLLAFDFPGISTTTPGFGTFVPSRVELLSTTTISRYYPDNIRLAMLFLITCGLWLGLATDMFFSVRNKMHRV